MKIPLELEYRKMFYELENQIFDSNFWSEGKFTKAFEDGFSAVIGGGARSMSSGGTALYAILEYIGVKDHDVIVPANTYWADTRAVQLAGGHVIYADCNKEDLCLSYDDLLNKITPNTKAVILVHIGGHIAFQVNEIAALCRDRGIYLVEDCAHAHGAVWNEKAAGTFGFAGAYSFYATKTMPLGEGGMVVSHHSDFLKWVECFRNYGKQVLNGKSYYHIPDGFNFRISEFAAALGIVQLKRLDKILNWKRNLAAKYDEVFENRVKFPPGMRSGYYKYIVFDYALREQTGKVFAETDFGNVISGEPVDTPNSFWVARHHSCLPIYYGYEKADLSPSELKKVLVSEISELP